MTERAIAASTRAEQARLRLERGQSAWQIAWRRFRRHRLAMTGATVILLFVLAAVFAPVLTPYNYNRVPKEDIYRLAPPSLAPVDGAEMQKLLGEGVCVKSQALLWRCGTHPFGADTLGRDTLSRVLYGARISLFIGFTAAVISTLIGSLLGAVAGFASGRIDSVISRFTDIMLSLPQLPVLLILSGLLNHPDVPIGRLLRQDLGDYANLLIIVLVIVSLSWMSTTRLVRGEVLAIKQREFIDAARAVGAGTTRIIFRHLLPNAVAVILVQTTLWIGEAILIESGLSFLGLGVREPLVSWGFLLANAQGVVQDPNGLWASTFPGLFILLTVLCFNFLGDGLRDAFDPRAVR